MKKVAEVAVPRDIHRNFDYAIPDELTSKITIGARVRVVFNRDELTGFVVDLKEKSDFKGKLSVIKKLTDEEAVLSESMLRLAEWIAQYYISPLGMVLPAMVPASIGSRRATQNFVHLNGSLDEVIKAIDRLAASAPQQSKLLKALLAKEESPTSQDLLNEIGSTSSPLKSLEKKGIVGITRRARSIILAHHFNESSSNHELTLDQQHAIESIKSALGHPPKSLLLHGVNASGKTEVYLQAVEQALSLNKQAIVMVPEISLTPQLVARFENRFAERLALYHSQLTEAQRAAEWKRIATGEADVVIGVRSAVFAPLKRLGLIIIDEEHEHTYKQEDPVPRYHAREVALKRAELDSAVVLLGSGTPSLESYQDATLGRHQLIEMPKRVHETQPPDIEIVDMMGGKNLLSDELINVIHSTIDSNNQVLLLLNLRGFSRALFCKSCRGVQRCPQCNIALVYHMDVQRLLCHYCGKTYPVGKCRTCKSDDLEYLGMGSEQAEGILKEAFPDVAIARMDSDSMKRDQHGELLESFRQNQIQVLLGTQMIGLGLDFPNVTLVGILSADTMLNVPDFRAGERTFQLISQAIGRSGRGKNTGRVIIQTHQPENYALELAARGEYVRFFNEEMENRQLFEYPPIRHLIKITCGSSREELAESKANEIVDTLRKLEVEDCDLLDPFKAKPYRLRGEYRWRVVLSIGNPDHIQTDLIELLNAAKASVQIKVDVDPQTLLH